MKPREELPATVPLPPAAVRRIEAAEKARLLSASPPADTALELAGPPLVKLTTRIFPEQMAWMREEIARYRAHHPRSPRLTAEELTRIALDHLRKSRNLDSLVAKYRS